MSTGKDRLWGWFSCSRASWITLPRTMAQEMPDEWQDKMAELLEQWDDTWDSSSMPSPSVVGRLNGKLTKFPEFLLNYRRPDKAQINTMRIK